MPDDKQQDKNKQEPQDQTPPAGAQNAEHMIPKTRFDDVNNRRKTAEDALEALRKQQADDEAARLEKQGEYKDLYEGLKTENEQLKTKAERADQLQESIAAGNQKRIAQLPEAMQALVPEYDDPAKVQAWLDANMATLAPGKVTPPPLDGGAGVLHRPDKGQVKLTPDEIKLAKLSDMTVEEYAKSKQERAGFYMSPPSQE